MKTKQSNPFISILVFGARLMSSSPDYTKFHMPRNTSTTFISTNNLWNTFYGQHQQEHSYCVLITELIHHHTFHLPFSFRICNIYPQEEITSIKKTNIPTFKGTLKKITHTLLSKGQNIQWKWLLGKSDLSHMLSMPD